MTAYELHAKQMPLSMDTLVLPQPPWGCPIPPRRRAAGLAPGQPYPTAPGEERA